MRAPLGWVVIGSVACGGHTKLPPPAEPTRYIPEVTGTIPPLVDPERTGRVLVDARGPDGEVIRFRVSARLGIRERTLLCAEVPCLLDLPLQRSFELIFESPDRDDLAGDVMTRISMPMMVLLVRVGYSWRTTDYSQKPSFVAFEPPPELRQRYRGDAP